MSEIHIVRDYAYPPELVWTAVTDPGLIPRWTATGQGARPVGFAPVVGTHFRFVAQRMPGWSGVVDCEVLDAMRPTRLGYSWQSDRGARTYVTYSLEPIDGGTRFTFDHTGFTGLSGWFMARLLGSVRRRMLSEGLPAVLESVAQADSRPSPPPHRPRG